MSDAKPPSRFGQTFATWLVLAVVPPLVLLAAYDPISKPPFGVRLWFDDYDTSVYVNASRWVNGPGTLYVDVTSEYPPAANLIFAAVRLVADALRPLPGDLDSFVWVWVTVNWWVYLAVARLTLRRLPRHALWLWVNPVTLYFSLLKFDLYPTALTYLVLHAASRERYLTAAAWLGLAAAVKGYPLFFAPVFVAFVWRRAGFSQALRGAVICGPIFVGPLVVVASYAGVGNATLPFRYHAARVLDERAGASLYDVLIHNLGLGQVRSVNHNRVPTLLQLATVALAVSLWPARVDRFASSAALAVMGFVTFSRFFSPQFVIWLVPFAAYADSRPVRLSVLAMLAATYLVFPIAFDYRDLHDADAPGRPLYYSVAVVVALLTRLVVMWCALAAGRDHRGSGA